MADTAAFLVEEVFPPVPVRQWVLSVPWPVRFALARDAKLLSRAIGVFVQEVFRDLRRRSGITGSWRRTRDVERTWSPLGPGSPNARTGVVGVRRVGTRRKLRDPIARSGVPGDGRGWTGRAY